MGRFGLPWVALGPLESVLISFWVILSSFGLLWLVLGSFGSPYVILAQFRSPFGSFWLALGCFGPFRVGFDLVLGHFE